MSANEESDRKAGHPPAIKAGGMRVASKQKVSEKQDPDAYDKKYVDQLPEKSTITAPVPAPIAQKKGNLDGILPATINKNQNKPQPTVEKAHSPSKAKQINQPRK